MLAWPVTAGNDFEETPHLEGYALTKALAAVESQRHIPSVTVIEPDNTAVGVVEGEYHQFFSSSCNCKKKLCKHQWAKV